MSILNLLSRAQPLRWSSAYFSRPSRLLTPARTCFTLKAQNRKDVNENEVMSQVKTFNPSSRIFITPFRAMEEYLLQPQDLSGLRKALRMSPYADKPPIVVYLRRDVEARSGKNLTGSKCKYGNQISEFLNGTRPHGTFQMFIAVLALGTGRIFSELLAHERANQVWGCKENIRKEKKNREGPAYHEALRRIRILLGQQGKDGSINSPTGLTEGSGRVVLTAIMINGGNFVIKLVAWYVTGSHSLFAEAIHSLADTLNQIILAYGIHKSTQRANILHPYGYSNMRHLASLISGVGIFCVGAGLSFYHGLAGLIGGDMESITSLYWGLGILGVSAVSEGGTFILAMKNAKERAKEAKMSVKDFILRGHDPSLSVVIMEDAAAVAGVGIAAASMSLAMYLHSPIPDALGSLVIGGLLGGVASFIIHSNAAALVGRSIPRENLERINHNLENDIMIRALHDVKGIDMGEGMVRYKAEVDFDGWELTRAYIGRQDLETMLEEVKGIETTDELEGFLLRHGENIVHSLGIEIDRVEKKLRKSHPEIRHCDLEIL